MKITFNQDGSVKSTEIDRSVNQNSGTILMEVEVDGLSSSDFVAVANYRLPSGQVTQRDCQVTEGKCYAPITSTETIYPGLLVMSLSVAVSETRVEWTFPIELKVNRTVEEVTVLNSAEHRELSERMDAADSSIEALSEAIEGKRLYRYHLYMEEGWSNHNSVWADFLTTSPIRPVPSGDSAEIHRWWDEASEALSRSAFVIGAAYLTFYDDDMNVALYQIEFEGGHLYAIFPDVFSMDGLFRESMVTYEFLDPGDLDDYEINFYGGEI